MGEHVNGLHGGDAVVHVEFMEVAGLRGGIARDIDNTLGSSTEDGLDYIGMHAGTWWVGDDDIRTAMLCDERIGQDVFHVAGKEEGVADVVDVGVYLRILNGFWDVFDADDLTGLACHEVGDGACAGIEVIDNLIARQIGKLAGDAVEMVGLLGISLVETFGADLEVQILHEFKDMILALEDKYILIADGVVALLVVEVHQGGDLRECVCDVLEESESLGLATRLVVMELEDDHPFARSRVADDDIAEQTYLLTQIEERDTMLQGVVAHFVADLVVEVVH